MLLFISFFNVFLVCFVCSTVDNQGIFVWSYSSWFILNVFSVFITHGKAAAFLFMLCKLSWIEGQQADRQCVFHCSILLSVMYSALFLLFDLNYTEWHHKTKH